MLTSRIGPYYHPTQAHEYKYWVRGMTEKDGYMLVSKADPYEPTEYQVNLNKGVRIGEICECPHHRHRKVPCMHMHMARDAKDTLDIWVKAGMV